MKVTIIGAGYVGLVTAACLTKIGHDVMCHDTDPRRIRLLSQAQSPIYEPGLEDLIAEGIAAGKLSFTTNLSIAAAHAPIIFIAVGTPSAKGGESDMTQVHGVIRNLAPLLSDFNVLVNKSTVPVGTAAEIERVLNCGSLSSKHSKLSVVSNPEFLREGSAIKDFLLPDRVLLGVGNSPRDRQALLLLQDLYAPIIQRSKLYVMSQRSAEFSKYAANAMLATRISFMNELSKLADSLGFDIEDVRMAIGSDTRIGHEFLKAGTGYGGSCFAKDLRSLLAVAAKHEHKLRILESVETTNEEQKKVLVRKLLEYFGASLSKRKFAVWGLAFKAQTDDMREAPSRVVIDALARAGARIVAHDPAAMDTASCVLTEDLADDVHARSRVSFAETPQDALKGADALIIMTDWEQYKTFDLADLKNSLKSRVIFDGRNMFSPQDIKLHGIEYISIGRATPPTMQAQKIAVP